MKKLKIGMLAAAAVWCGCLIATGIIFGLKALALLTVGGSAAAIAVLLDGFIADKESDEEEQENEAGD